MFKKGDDVMFWFLADEIVIGRGKIHEVKEYVILISWYEGRIVTVVTEDVYPFDDDKYYEMNDNSDYDKGLDEVTSNEMSRLRKICTGEDHV